MSRRILQNGRLGKNKQPGMLCSNMERHDGVKFQEPHWDLIGWRHTKAEDMPWVVHVPLCKEGMMVHVLPTERDEGSHSLTPEEFKLRDPQLVHVA